MIFIHNEYERPPACSPGEARTGNKLQWPKMQSMQTKIYQYSISYYIPPIIIEDYFRIFQYLIISKILSITEKISSILTRQYSRRSQAELGDL